MVKDTNLLEELARLPTFTNPTASPSGDRVALCYDITGRNQLHVLDMSSGEMSQWSDGEIPRTAKEPIYWGPNGDRIFYHKDQGGDEQHNIYGIYSDGRTEAIITRDGQNKLFDVGVDENVLLFGSTSEGQLNLYIHELNTDNTRRITNYDRSVESGILSPDCGTISYETNEQNDLGNQDTYIADSDGSNSRNLKLGVEGAESIPYDWSSDGNRLLVYDTTEDLGRCGVYDVCSGRTKWLGDGSSHEEPVAFMPDDERVLAIRTRAAADVGVIYDLKTETARELRLPEGVNRFPQFGNPVIDSKTVLVVHATPTNRPELLAYDIEADEHETLIEAEYGDLHRGLFQDAEYFRVTSNGVAETTAQAVSISPSVQLDIECLLYDSGERPSPLIVNPHGGPPVQDKQSFDLYTQFLLIHGYSVLQINYRGSAGRGRKFREELYGDWGGAEQADIARAVEHVLGTMEWVDNDRVAILGGSYGGYSAYWQLVQYPDLYNAGVAWIGVSDLEDMYENTMPHFQTGLMEKYLGTPEENPDLYTERSPVTHSANIKAPVCIVHGVNDRRVPVSQARIFREELKKCGFEEGTDFEYHELGGEGHGSSDIEQKIRSFKIIEDFLSRRLDGPSGVGD